jgi:chemotaxis protein MotB
MPEPKSQPIIIFKKTRPHGEHHGGAWKVAYADFVTAMMALFIVLWLMNSSKEIQQAVGGYFRDPTGHAVAVDTQPGAKTELQVGKEDMSKLEDAIKTELQNLTQAQELRNQVQFMLGKEGLRVELLETEKGMFFESGSALPSANGRELLVMLAQQLGKLPNRILIEGHTDSKPYAGKGQYSNWELSADRANAARRLMEANGLRPGQVIQVRGFADQRLRNQNDPLDASNRRISVIVLYQQDQAAEEQNTPVQPLPH